MFTDLVAPATGPEATGEAGVSWQGSKNWAFCDFVYDVP